MVDANWQAIVIGKPQIVKESFGLRAGVVEDQRGFMGFDLLQHSRDGVGRATAEPGRLCWSRSKRYNLICRLL